MPIHYSVLRRFLKHRFFLQSVDKSRDPLVPGIVSAPIYKQIAHSHSHMFLAAIISLLFLFPCYLLAATGSVQLTAGSILINGQPVILRGGTLQWFRIPRGDWEDRIQRFKALGYNMIDMYVAWQLHEPERGRFDFTTHDLAFFLQLAKVSHINQLTLQKYELYVYFRPGPYITNEMDAGGVRAASDKHKLNPYKLDGTMNIRTNDRDFMAAVENYFSRLNQVIRPFLFSNGGPIVLYAIENEYSWFLDIFEKDKSAELDDGMPERPPGQILDGKDYMTQLRDIAIKVYHLITQTGINVPITTCPGDGRLTGTFDVPFVHPMPNFYFTLNVAEYSMFNLEKLLRQNPTYRDTPLGVTETCRDAWVYRRFLLTGARVISQFNAFGYHQGGRMNAMTSNTDAWKGVSVRDLAVETVVRGIKLDSLLSPGTGVFRYPIGLFPGVLDFNGPVTPSGQLRDKFHHIRRTSLFVDAFEQLIASSLPVRRIASDGRLLDGADYRIKVFSKLPGSSDPDAGGAKVNYWLPLRSEDCAILGLLNFFGEKDMILPLQSVEAFGMKFPNAYPLTIPFEEMEAVKGASRDRTYMMFIPINFPLGPGLVLRYSTSEILSARTWNQRTIVVLYGKAGTGGEFRIKASGLSLQTHGEFQSTKIAEDEFLLSYIHLSSQPLSILMNDGFREIQFLVIDSEMAGRTWIIQSKNTEMILFGADYVADPTGRALIHQQKEHEILWLLSPKSPQLQNSFITKHHDPQTLLTKFMLLLKNELTTHSHHALRGFVKSDTTEALAEYSPVKHEKWIQLGPRLEYLEKISIPGGHAWYRGQIVLEPHQILNKTTIFLDHASDFVSIYINGQYIVTLFPVGTEIDSENRDKHYGFDIPNGVLKVGRNVVSIKVEVWGAGSFGFPRGKYTKWPISIPGFKPSFPALGYDSVKGLGGTMLINGLPVTDWAVKSGLRGENKQWFKMLPDATWKPLYRLPIRLHPGQNLWFSAQFDHSIAASKSNEFAPRSLRILGRNARATIYLNGQLIGRWISDNDWLQKGNWLNVIRNLWTVSTPVDDIPISQSLLRIGTNLLVISFEDCSDPINHKYGIINSINIKHSSEILTSSGSFTSRTYEKVNLF